MKKTKKRDEYVVNNLSGISIKKPITKDKYPEFANCIIKGIAEFMIVFGSLGGFVSAFDIEYNPLFLGIVFLSFSIYLSSLFAFKKSWKKDVGYIVFFVVYVMGLFSVRTYVNSGFAAALNEVRNHYEVYFGIESGNEFSELVEDRYLAVSIMLVFVGSFEILLLNIFISNYMSFKLTVFVALFLYIFPLYTRDEPGIGYILCMLLGLMLVYIMKNGEHFKDEVMHEPFVKKEKRPGLYRRMVNHLSKKDEMNEVQVRVEYTQNPYVYAGIGVVSLACVLIVLIFSILFDSTDYRGFYKENEYKAATKDTVSAVVLLGLRGLSPWGYSVGGMNGGNFRNIGAVRPMNQTHLKVTYAPYSNRPVYLKAYTGLKYMQGRWASGYELTGETFGWSQFFVVESIAREAKKLREEYEYTVRDSSEKESEVPEINPRMERAFEGKGTGILEEDKNKKKTGDGEDADKDSKAEKKSASEKTTADNSETIKNEKASRGKMDIENVDASELYAYYPYFTVFDDYDYYINHKYGNDDISERSVSGSDQSGNNTLNKIVEKKFVPSKRGREAKKSFTYYPNIDYNSNVGDMDSYVYKDVPEINKGSVDRFLQEAGISASDPDKIIKVVDYLKTNYKYNYSPGLPKGNKEIINYFLDENKKGVCYHFASACVLILRRLGVSARYVEGYAFSYEQALDGEVRDDLKYEDYYDGYSKITDRKVMEVNVTDSNAHAWVEVYNGDKGWIVVDPTPAVALEGEGSDFLASISRMLNDTSGADLDGVMPKIDLAFFASDGMKLTMLIIIFLGILALFIRLMMKKYKVYKMLNTDDNKLNLIRHYRVLDEKKKRRDGDYAKLNMPAEKIKFLFNSKNENGFDDFVSAFEKACFSKTDLGIEEYKSLLERLKKLYH